jgi:hypothetical protein
MNEIRGGQPSTTRELNEQRKEAIVLLQRTFATARMVYIEKIAALEVNSDDVKKPLARLERPTRQQMWDYIQAVILLEPDFATEISQALLHISQLLEIKSSGTIAANTQEGIYVAQA